MGTNAEPGSNNLYFPSLSSQSRQEPVLPASEAGSNTETVPGSADFDPLGPETFASFHEEFAELRQRCPVAHSDAWNGFWAFTRYDDVVVAAGDPAMFTTTVQNVVPKVAFTGRRPPLHLDPPDHTPYRRALNPFFTSEKMTAMEPAIRRVVVELLEPLIATGGGDICAEFTHRLPGYVLAEFFNLTSGAGDGDPRGDP